MSSSGISVSESEASVTRLAEVIPHTWSVPQDKTGLSVKVPSVTHTRGLRSRRCSMSSSGTSVSESEATITHHWESDPSQLTHTSGLDRFVSEGALSVSYQRPYIKEVFDVVFRDFCIGK